MPFVYGFAYVLLSALFKNIKDPRTRLFIIGAVAGELYSLAGHFGLYNGWSSN